MNFEDIIDFDGLYKINRAGEIFNVRWNRILKQSNNGGGYKVIGLTKNGLKKMYLVHRLLALQFIENPENKRCVDHIDRNRQNNNLENIRWATDSENCSNRAVNGNISKITKFGSYQAFYRIEPNNIKTKCFKTREECEIWLIEMKTRFPR